MVTNRFFFCLILGLSLASACAISKKKELLRQSDNDAGSSDSSNASIFDDADDGGIVSDARSREDTGGTSADSGTGRIGGSDSEIAVCGNGRVEGDEACDDGNLNSRDGCTPACEFSCDDDSDCDDLNSCNGIEICTSDGACDDSDSNLEEGAECGEDKSCWRGVCVRNVCGDGKRDRGEACDDGNLDSDDGCTPDCELTCEDDGDCSNDEPCLGDRACRDDGQHGGLRVCIGGTRLEDGTGCKTKDAKTKAMCGDPDVDKNGWCVDGVCTCVGCGDGQVNETEACDDGPLNGTADSPNDCALNCQVVTCGNGVLEGDEACDDGNRRRMDGCDPECRYELAHRFTGLRILKDVDVPKWCKHQNNRFADAFAEEVSILGMTSLNALDVFSRQISVSMTGGDTSYLLHIIDSDDSSTKTIDDDITVGLYHAYPDITADQSLDAPFIIYPNQLARDTLLPADHHAVRAIQAGGGRVISREPATVEMVNLLGDFVLMRDFMMELVFDLTTLSRPQVEPFASRDTIAVSEALRIPEVAGRDPMGLFCGAISREFMNQPIYYMSRSAGFGPAGGGPLCCKNSGVDIGSPYRSCVDGVLTDQCDSVGDLVHQGCTYCIDVSSTDDIVNYLFSSDYLDHPCESMQTNPASCFTVINGIEYDVDSDGDGENDSWSALFSFETERVRIYDVAVQ